MKLRKPAAPSPLISPPTLSKSAAAVNGWRITKVACEGAINELEMGNYNRAIKLMTEAAQKFKDCTVTYLVQACIFSDKAVSGDQNWKKRMKNLESSSRAITKNLCDRAEKHLAASKLGQQQSQLPQL
ncbi:hypothetical protein QQ045_016344 [Rhodiola kirilowii]